jgi:hypothetical protein
MIDKCKGCGSENIQAGYGMAYGGMGVYFYCADCDQLQEKHQDPEYPELDPDVAMEEREERKRIAAEMDGPHEEGP